MGTSTLSLACVRGPAQLNAWTVEQLSTDTGTIDRRVTLLTDTAAHAHQIERTCAVDLESPGLLFGVRTMRPVGLARDLTARSGSSVAAMRDGLRRLHLARLFVDGSLDGHLHYFSPASLRRSGYVEAFARTILDLEQAGLSARRLLEIARSGESVDTRIADVAAVWRECELLAAGSDLQWTAGALYQRARATLEEDPDLARPFGRVICLLSRDPSPALVEFLAALPSIDAAYLDTDRDRRPTSASLPGLARCDLERVPSAPARAEDDARGALTIEEFASIDDEIDAAVGWILAQIDAGLALEEIAVVCTQVDVYAPLVRERLSHTLLRDGVPRTVVLDRSLARHTPAGTTFAKLLDALVHWLPESKVSPLLPLLRPCAADHVDPEDEPPSSLSPSRARDLSTRAGIVGGHASEPRGALEWTPRLGRLRAQLDPAQSQLQLDLQGDSGDRRAAEIQHAEDLALARAAEMAAAPLRELESIVALLLERATLDALWTALAEYVRDWLWLPWGGELLMSGLDRELRLLCRDPVADHVRGTEALATIQRVFHDLRLNPPQEPVPAVTIASPRLASGLTFRAVRIVGLAEGLAPSHPSEDPVLPDATRLELGALTGAIVEPSTSSTVRQVEALERVIDGATERVALSSPRQWIDGSSRERAGLLLELELSGSRSDSAPPLIAAPTAKRPGPAENGSGEKSAVENGEPPLLQSAFQRWVARQSAAVPGSWVPGPGSAIGLERVRELWAGRRDRNRFTRLDGDLSSVWRSSTAHGMTPETAISPSRLRRLLQCPYLYLLEHVLGMREPPEEPSSHAIAPREYGTLVHKVMEELMRTHGEAICRGAETLDVWRDRACKLARAEFERFTRSYSLRSDEVLAREWRRLEQDVSTLVEYEWTQPERRFVAAELVFGFDDPVVLRTADRDTALYVRGKIDRADRTDDGRWIVRDYKTGRLHSLTEKPIDPLLDVQIATYARALASKLEVTAGASGAPGAASVESAAYVHPSPARDRERRFDATTLADLDRALDTWLSVASALLSAGQFPRTTDKGDCTFCRFKTFCGTGCHAESADKLAHSDPQAPIARFRRLRDGELDD